MTENIFLFMKVLDKFANKSIN